MKKIARSVFAVAAALAMVLTTATTAFAGTVKVTKQGSEFTAYKLFETEDLGNDKYLFTQTALGKGFFDSQSRYTFDKNVGITDTTTGKVIASSATDDNPHGSDGHLLATAPATDMQQFAGAVANYVRTSGATGTKLANGSATDLGTGYYVILETATSGTGTIASLPIIRQVKANDALTITPKDDTVGLEKNIVEGDTEVKADDKSVGDTVDYVVRTNVPVYQLASGESYDMSKFKFELTDTFSSGLTYNGDVKVTGLSSGEYTTSFSNGKLVVSLTPEGILAHQGQQITLNYSATVNGAAVVNSTTGNPNTIELKYSNNPSHADDYGTLTDQVTTYVYRFKIHKVDGTDTDTDLAGAAFAIYKGNSTADADLIATWTYDDNGDPVITYGGTGADHPTVQVANKNDDENPYVVVSGLDEGVYTIKETVHPEGYELLPNPIHVKISAVTDPVTGLPTGDSTMTLVDTLSKDADVEVSASDADKSIDLVVRVKNYIPGTYSDTGSTQAAMYIGIGVAVLVVAGILIAASRRKSPRNA